MPRGDLECPWCSAVLSRDARHRCDRCGRPIEIYGDVVRHGSLRVSGAGQRRSSDLVALAIGANTTIVTLLVATQSIPLAVISLIGGVVALSLQSLAGTRGGLRVEHDRLLEAKGVVVLREHVARVLVTVTGLRIDTVHGETRHADLEVTDDARRVLDEIHLAWPELTRFDRRTLVRNLVVRPRGHLTSPPREPFVIERAQPGEGYRDGRETSIRLVHAEEPRWSIVEEHGSFAVEHAGTTTRIAPPIVLIHLWRGGVRIVTAEGEISVRCTRERDAREAVRLVRHLLLGVG